jgi:hypothetical protein
MADVLKTAPVASEYAGQAGAPLACSGAVSRSAAAGVTR